MFMKKIIKKYHKLEVLIVVLIIALAGMVLVKLQSSYAAEDYLVGDYVYYNPFTDTSCNPSSYWTLYNSKERCYRWIVLYKTTNSTTNDPELRLLLDHNYFNKVTFSELYSKINELKSLWPNSNVTTIGSSAILNVMNFDVDKAIAEVKANGTVGYGGSGKYLAYLASNSYYINDSGNIEYTNGFWVGPTNSTYTPPSGKAYAYINLAFRMIDDTDKSGVRPAIQVSTSKVGTEKNYRRDMNSGVTINGVLNGDQYNGLFETYSNSHWLQGFDAHNNVYCLYLANMSSDTNPGYIFCNDTKEFKAASYGHANDMSYNSNTNKYIVEVDYHSDTTTRAISFHEVARSNIANIDTKLTGSTTAVSLRTPGRSAIGYDSEHDYYYIGNAFYLAPVKAGENTAYSRAIINTATDYGFTSQGIEYHKGYIYDVYYNGGSSTSNLNLKSWEKGACNRGLVRCDKYAKEQGLIYVYNAKLSKNGTPGKGYGKLVMIWHANFLKKSSSEYFQYVDSSRSPSHNEIENISFASDSSDVMYMATETQYSSGYYPKIYSVSLDDQLSGGSPGKYLYATTVKYTDTTTEEQKYYWNDIIDTNYYDLGDKHLGWIYSRTGTGVTNSEERYVAKNSSLKTTVSTTKNGITENLSTVKLESSKYTTITSSTSAINVNDENIQTFLNQLTCTRCTAVVLEDGSEKTSGSFVAGKTYQLKIKAADPSGTQALLRDITPVYTATIPTDSLCVSRTYNGSTQVLTSVTTGTGYSLSGYSKINAGTYTITATLSSGYKWSDDTTTDKTFNCSINKKNITIKADNKEMEYGSSAPTYTYTVTGAVSGDTAVSGTASYTVKNSGNTTITVGPTTPSGTYTIYVSGLTATENYTVSATNTGTLTVNEAGQTVYNITYNLGGGTGTNPTSYTINTNTFTLNEPTKEGYAFTGWTGSNGNTPQKTVTITQGSTGDKTYTANWETKNYTISYDLNGGTADNPSLYDITTSTFTLNNPTKEGYTFTGWTGSNGTTPEMTVTIEQGSTGNKTYTANYTVNSYTITFNSNGGTSVSPITKNYGETVTAPTNPTKEDYTFAGWYSDSELTRLYTFTTMPSRNLTLYAKWAKDEFVINYVVNGGENDDTNPTTYVEGNTIRIKTPVKTGYSFKGWYKDASFTERVEEITSDMTGDLTLYAKWEINQYTISFDTNGGNTINSITKNYKEELSEPTNPTKEGYEFKGWYKDEGFTELYNFDTMPAENITLYAKWEPVEKTKEPKENTNTSEEKENTPKEKTKTSELETIKVPDTGQNMSTIAIISGIVLVFVGTYLSYIKYKKSSK